MSAPELASNDCPQPPGFRAHLRTLILHEACQTAGGIEPLATLLGVPEGMLARWLDGLEEAPDSVYQACIVVVLLLETKGEAHSAPRTAG